MYTYIHALLYLYCLNITFLLTTQNFLLLSCTTKTAHTVPPWDLVMGDLTNHLHDRVLLHALYAP